MSGSNRSEHLAWCKRRALEYVDAGDLRGALTSMTSDIGKHKGTASPELSTLGLQLFLGGHLGTPERMRDWIEGFW